MCRPILESFLEDHLSKKGSADEWRYLLISEACHFCYLRLNHGSIHNTLYKIQKDFARLFVQQIGDKQLERALSTILKKIENLKALVRR